MSRGDYVTTLCACDGCGEPVDTGVVAHRDHHPNFQPRLKQSPEDMTLCPNCDARYMRATARKSK